MSEENVEIVRRVLEGFQAMAEDRDFRRTDLIEAGLVVSDFLWVPVREMPSAATYRGVDEFAGFMETWTEDLDGWRFDVERLINGDRDHVVAVVVQHATAKASGAPVGLRWGVLFELKGGQVVKMQHFLDIEEAIEAAGHTDGGAW